MRAPSFHAHSWHSPLHSPMRVTSEITSQTASGEASTRMLASHFRRTSALSVQPAMTIGTAPASVTI
jgi:hypothetical protein